jgi:hypothetical protein
MSETYTVNDFLELAKNKPEETKKILREELRFTEEGVGEMFAEAPDKCGPYFTKLIGEAFDPANDGHVTRVLEAGVVGPQPMAETCFFIYTNFTEDEQPRPKAKKAAAPAPPTEPVAPPTEATVAPSAPAEVSAAAAPPITTTDAQSAPEQKKRKPRAARAHVDRWADKAVPFTEGSKAAVIFEELQRWSGTKVDFYSHIEKVLAERKFETKTQWVPTLVYIVIRDAKKRGWQVDELDGRVTMTKLPLTPNVAPAIPAE